MGEIWGEDQIAIWKLGTSWQEYAVVHSSFEGGLFVYHDEEKLKAWDLLAANSYFRIAVIFWEDQMTNIFICYRWRFKICWLRVRQSLFLWIAESLCINTHSISYILTVLHCFDSAKISWTLSGVLLGENPTKKCLRIPGIYSLRKNCDECDQVL